MIKLEIIIDFLETETSIERPGLALSGHQKGGK